MAIDLEDEILQDFLVEAGEIVELLGEQLVELEKSPGDYDLLNAIFRGFHTIKGGAGFVAIEPLVSVCHKAEDVFNVLRQGDRQVSQALMDVVLEVVDVVHSMFESVRIGQDPDPANAELLQRLQKFTTPQSADEEVVAPQRVAAAEVVDDSGQIQEIISPTRISDVVEQEFEAMLDAGDQSSVDDDSISEAEFDDLLDTLQGNGMPMEEETLSGSPGEDITEAEFDALLDQLHGKGKFSAEKLHVVAPEPEDNSAIAETVSSGNDDITEAEFDNILDSIHGKGKFSAASLANIAEDVPSTPAEMPEPPVLQPPPASANSQKPAQSSGKSEVKAKAPAQAAKPEPAREVPVSRRPESRPVVAAADLDDGENGAKKAAKPGAAVQTENTVRVDTQVLDDIMNMVGELVLVRNRFQTLRTTFEVSEQMSKTLANLDIVTADLQLAVMKTRMQPIKKVFGRFPRVVRDLARSLNKEIRLELVGEETDLDKNLVEALADPLVHLVRNAVDHGIESPEERVAAGKPREGLVVLKASQEGDHIELSIKDNGKGMNPNTLRAKVVEKGLMDEDTAARLDNKECFNLIFLPGFSTKSEISDVSGRGVGMDVVKTRITQMNGTVEIDSKEGIGSTIIIKVPLTLAIMPTLMVMLGNQTFALPLASVLEILDVDLKTTNVVDGQLVIMVRRKALPLFYLSDWLINDPSYALEKKRMGHVVVVSAGGRQVGFVVDKLIGQEEVVIKALGAKLQGLDGLSGATITGDGKIALILDVPGLMKRYAT